MRALKICTTALGLVVLIGCQAQPVFAPFGTEISVSPESFESKTSNVFLAFSAVLFDPVTNRGLNDTFVEVSTGGAGAIYPSEAISVASNQVEAEGWCAPYLESDPPDQAAYDDCMNNFYASILDYDELITADYARVVTDARGVASWYMQAFCYGDSNCLFPGKKDQVFTMVISSGVSNQTVTMTLLKDDEEE